MAAGKMKVYELAKFRIGNLTIDLSDATNWKIQLMLSTSNANTLSVGTNILADLTNEVAAAFGYATGGVALSSVTWTRSGGTITFDAADLSPAWSAVGGAVTGRFLVVYKNATVNTIVKPLLCVCLCDTTPADASAPDGNPFNITFNAAGLFTLSGATVD